MLRSQSISNLNDQRKSKSSNFFSSFRSRKASSNDLHSIVDSTARSNNNNNPKPLNTSVTSNNLHQKFDTSNKLNPISHSSSAAQQRQYHGSSSLSSSTDDKENINPTPIHTRTKSLKLRSSAPNLNLNLNLNLNQSSSHSVTVSTTAATATATSTKNTINQLHTRGLRSSMFLNNIISYNPSESDNVSHKSQYSGRISPPHISPETITSVDTLMDQSSIKFTDFENTSQDFDSSDASISSISNESSPTEQNFPNILNQSNKKSLYRKSQSSSSNQQHHNLKKIHRTTNSYNINEFIKILNQENATKLPVNNRKSLELEALEREKLINTLNEQKKDSYTSTLSLIENIMFLIVKDNEDIDENDDQYKSEQYFKHSLDDIDYSEALKEDHYDDIDENLVMVF